MALVSALLLPAAQAGAAALIPELQPLAFVAGSCWRGTFPDGRRTDTHCFTPIYGGAFLRDVHVVEGAPTPYSGETLFRWDSQARTLRFDYYASDGAHTAGVALPVAGGLSFPEARRASDGREMRIETRWIHDGADAYLVRSEIVEGTNWRRAAEHADGPRRPGPPARSGPSARRLLWPLAPMMTWSCSVTFRCRPASARSRVRRMSCWLGEGSPLGWLWTTMIAVAWRSSARRMISRI